MRRGRTAWAFVVAGLFGLASSYALPVAATIQPGGSDPLTVLDTPRFAFPTVAEPGATGGAEPGTRNGAEPGTRSGDLAARGSERSGEPGSAATAPGDTLLSSRAGGSHTAAGLEAFDPAARSGADAGPADSAAGAGPVRAVPETGQVPVEVVENRYATEDLPKPPAERRDRFAGVPIVENSYGALPPRVSDPVALGHAQPAPDRVGGLGIGSPGVSPRVDSPPAMP